MSLVASRNTLRHQLARPLCMKREMARVQATSTARAVKGLTNDYEGLLVSPEEVAVRFYLLQHAMSDIRQRFGMDEPLGDAAKVVELHHEHGVALGQRMFTYLLLICTREARHASGSISYGTKVQNQFGPNFVAFLAAIKGSGTQDAIDHFTSNPPDMELGSYTEGLEFVFRKGTFHGGYGGEAWANIAEVLNWFVQGTISAEMMLDTAFTLAHNGGPIFNKGMCFKMYNQTRLRMVLDIQASGQIPQLIDSVMTYQESAAMVSYENRSLFQACKKGLGDSFGGEIDWFKVTQNPLAHSHQYAALKQIQCTKFGMPGWVKGAEAEAAKNEAAAKAKQKKLLAAKKLEAAKEAAILNAAHFTVGIGSPLKKESRDE